MANISDVIDALTPSLSEEPNAVTFEEYRVQIVSECQNPGCGNEFNAPIIILVDNDTMNGKYVVCADCPTEIVESDEDNESESEDLVSANDNS